MTRRKKLFYITLVAIIGIGYAAFPYFQKKETVKIDVEFLKFSNTPLINVIIQEKKYPLRVDLGVSGICLEIRKNIFEDIRKRSIATAIIMDINENKYETEIFAIPSARAGAYIRRNLTACIEDPYFLLKGAQLKIPSRPDLSAPVLNERVEKLAGRVGRDFFQGKRLLFDLAHHAIFVVNDEEFLKNYDLESFSQTTLENGPQGFVITIETDIGPTKFLLDTGAELSIIRRSLVEHLPNEEVRPGLKIFTNNRFAAGGTELGAEALGLYDIPAACGNIDGLLGIEFFAHPIYLDIKAGKAYIGPKEL